MKTGLRIFIKDYRRAAGTRNRFTVRDDKDWKFADLASSSSSSSSSKTKIADEDENEEEDESLALCSCRIFAVASNARRVRVSKFK
jgi:hypothetical protein